jgi:hypothetical protein
LNNIKHSLLFAKTLLVAVHMILNRDNKTYERKLTIAFIIEIHQNV